MKRVLLATADFVKAADALTDESFHGGVHLAIQPERCWTISYTFVVDSIAPIYKSKPARIWDSQVTSNLFESTLILKSLNVQSSGSDFLKARGRAIVMLLNELTGQGEILGRLPPILVTKLAKEKADVQKHDDQIIKSTECLFFDRKCAITISLITTLHLHPDNSGRLLRVRMDANEIVAFIVWRGFVGEDIPPHQLTD